MGGLVVFLGYWNWHDLLLLGTKEGKLQAAQVIHKRLDSRGDPRTSAFRLKATENTMALVCGDITRDGFPEVILGSGTPVWGYYDIGACGLSMCVYDTPLTGVCDSVSVFDSPLRLTSLLPCQCLRCLPVSIGSLNVSFLIVSWICESVAVYGTHCVYMGLTV